MIKVGIVGVGHLGEIHLKLILSSINFDLIGFYETNQEKSDLISKKYQVKSFKSLEDLSENVQAVIISTPTIHHHEIATFFLKNNIHVFIEKPITTNVKEANELVQLAKDSNLVGQVGHVERFNGAFTGDVLKAIIEGNELVISKLNSFGINIKSSGGETADVGDLVKTIIVDSTVVSRLKKSDVIDNSKIKSGNVIVGLASFGKTNYEDEYNSGIGSNGLTSARHDVFQKYLKEKYPETYDNSLDDSLVYTGSKKLTDKIEGYDHDIGKLVLSPTRTYAPVVKEIISKVGVSNIDGMIHCSGGAQTKVLHFVENKHIIKDNLFNTPIIFDLIQDESKTSWKEMYQVFNMGHRLEIYTDKLSAQKIIDISASFNLEAKIIGRVEDSKSNKLSISGDKGKFEY